MVCHALSWGVCPGGTQSCGETSLPDEPVCTNTAAHANVDDGCDENAPICVGEAGAQLGGFVVGTECVKCINDQESDASPWADSGCTSEAPRCVLADGATPVIWSVGSKCIS